MPECRPPSPADAAAYALPPCAKKALLIAFLVLAVGFAGYAPQAIKRSHRADFERYYTAGCIAARGGDIYQFGWTSDLEFKYFPMFAQAMSSISLFSEWVATGNATPEMPTERGLKIGAGIWYFIQAISYMGTLLMVILLCKPRSGKEALLLFAAGLLMSARFMNANIRNGQVNVPTMGVGMLGAYLAIRRRERAAGFLLALGALIKFVPALPVLWLLMRRQFAAVLYFAVSLLVLLVFAPSLTWKTGLKENVAQLSRYIDLRRHMVTDLPDEEAAGQSLPSMVNRLLRPVNAWPARLRDDQGRPRTCYINVTTISSDTAHKIAFTAALLMLGITLWLLRNNRAGLRPVMGIALCFLLALTASPESRKAHFVALMVPAIVLMAAALRSRWKKPYLIVLGSCFAVPFLLSREIWKDSDFYHNMNAYGVLLLAALTLFAALAHAIGNEPTGETPDARASDNPSR